MRAKLTTLIALVALVAAFCQPPRSDLSVSEFAHRRSFGPRRIDRTSSRD